MKQEAIDILRKLAGTSETLNSLPGDRDIRRAIGECLRRLTLLRRLLKIRNDIDTKK